MRSAGFAWADVSLDGRDVALSGTISTQAEADGALVRLASLSGVRSVAGDVTVAPLVKPYRMTANLVDGAIVLAGSVPNEVTRQALSTRAGVSSADLQLRSGMPDRDVWLSGIDFALAQLSHLDQGQVSITDLAINVTGRARSERDYGDVLLALSAQVPSGVTIADASIAAPFASPYRWSAVSDGKRISVSGFVPDGQVTDRLRMADLSGLALSTGVAVASGQPDNFVELSQVLVEQLSRLEYGEATISDGLSQLVGAAPTQAIADDVTRKIAQAGSIVVLDPPRIADYWVSATRQSGGVIVFDGYAPDDATRKALSEYPNADTQFLKLGRGAPNRYQSGVDFGLAALGRMSEGRFALHGDVVTLSGIARSGSDYEALVEGLAALVPQGLSLNTADITPPRAARYDWKASKDTSGAIALSGMVPNRQIKDELIALSGASTVSALTYASGEPNNFTSAAETGLGLLQWLGEGTVAFDGSGWLITGTAKSKIDEGAINADFTTRNLAASGWSMSVAAPVGSAAPVVVAAPAVEPEPEPEVTVAEAPAVTSAEDTPSEVVDPDYAFSATRGADKSVIMSGQLPADATLRYFATITGGETISVSIAPGAPEGFVTDAEAGLRALVRLDEGQVDLANGNWSLKGIAPDEATRDAVTAAIAALSDGKAWTLAVDVPVVAAEPVAAPPQPTTEKVDTAACIAPLADFSARNSILFQSGAAIIAAESQPALDELAGDLAGCPDAIVHIEGYTDSDGDERLNLALSVARAEAVVSALVERGVTAARLYALGFGEANPIADNGTPEGKRLNRRIVVKVLDRHY
ncbi:hypothetical protein WH87_05680 [Devosia epidermidihirudinis]|uniref:OmpA-like domain-containing protein n=1 Tax=Devosia epidermidihirudinis TaxID=1293439 RepID=A0A0F5QF90_9HYPH|nr:OmpA family protein [Devosia epidermidihirudinis]KKC39642.1 hypothetical protein WH87_05680 [Devosia epidermidihirudinis]